MQIMHHPSLDKTPLYVSAYYWNYLLFQAFYPIKNVAIEKAVLLHYHWSKGTVR
jgi:hypothetical protein